ncbi:MAG: hypothetical protein K0R09_144 [Clostridiales bacterium]|jgi:hypothetical protein|nr:hypothetical protein [Clostridiales bacterium]
MLRFFQICFLTGTAYTVISFLIGQLFDFVDIDGDVDFDGDVTGVNVSPLKPIVIVAFTTVFGGIGIISINLGLASLVALAIAICSGLFIAFVIYKYIVVPLYKAQNTSAASQTELIGHKAKMRLGTKGDSFGRISYVINDNTYTAPAKSLDGKEINIDEDVIIVEIRKNVFFVDKL